MYEKNKFMLILSLVLLFSLITSVTAVDSNITSIDNDLNDNSIQKVEIDSCENIKSIDKNQNSDLSNLNSELIKEDSKIDKNSIINETSKIESPEKINSKKTNLKKIIADIKESKINKRQSQNDLKSNIDLKLEDINTNGVILSDDEYSCGPAALATVLNNLGLNTSLEEVSKNTNTTEENGTNMESLINSAKNYGFNAYGVEKENQKLNENNIVHLTIDGIDHWSVVKNIDNESISLADSNNGNINLTIDEFNQYYNEKAIVISNKSDEELMNEFKTNNISILDNNTYKKISGKKTYKKIVGYRTVWKYGFIRKYGWRLQPVITGHGPKFSQWRYCKGYYVTLGWYKVKKPIYKSYTISNDKLTSAKYKKYKKNKKLKKR